MVCLYPRHLSYSGEYDLRGGTRFVLVGRIALNTTLVIPDYEYLYWLMVCFDIPGCCRIQGNMP